MEYDITIQLYGFAIQYFPYIFCALQRAGQQGLFREKHHYAITCANVHGKNILGPDGNIETNFSARLWEYNQNPDASHAAYSVSLLSPLRFQVGGRYVTQFSAQDFLLCIYRRFVALCALYGTYTCELAYAPSECIKIENAAVKWQRLQYHSHRQEQVVWLGGAFGTFELWGEFSVFERNLLYFASLFGAGKNTNFGLGDVSIDVSNKQGQVCIH